MRIKQRISGIDSTRDETGRAVDFVRRKSLPGFEGGVNKGGKSSCLLCFMGDLMKPAPMKAANVAVC